MRSGSHRLRRGTSKSMYSREETRDVCRQCTFVMCCPSDICRPLCICDVFLNIGRPCAFGDVQVSRCLSTLQVYHWCLSALQVYHCCLSALQVNHCCLSALQINHCCLSALQVYLSTSLLRVPLAQSMYRQTHSKHDGRMILCGPFVQL